MECSMRRISQISIEEKDSSQVPRPQTQYARVAVTLCVKTIAGRKDGNILVRGGAGGEKRKEEMKA
jgi:hypothetical protein